MKNFVNVKIREQQIKSIQCDKCGKTYYRDDNADLFEFQEFHSIKFTGSYGSIFGDGEQVECDICQHCLHEMIKDICRKKEVW